MITELQCSASCGWFCGHALRQRTADPISHRAAVARSSAGKLLRGPVLQKTPALPLCAEGLDDVIHSDDHLCRLSSDVPANIHVTYLRQQHFVYHMLRPESWYVLISSSIQTGQPDCKTLRGLCRRAELRHLAPEGLHDAQPCTQQLIPTLPQYTVGVLLLEMLEPCQNKTDDATNRCNNICTTADI